MPESRVARLLEEMSRLQGEIDRIRATGIVKTFSAVEINERFALVLAMARELVSDEVPVACSCRIVNPGVDGRVSRVPCSLLKLHRRSDCASSCAIATWPMASTSSASG